EACCFEQLPQVMDAMLSSRMLTWEQTRTCFDDCQEGMSPRRRVGSPAPGAPPDRAVPVLRGTVQASRDRSQVRLRSLRTVRDAQPTWIATCASVSPSRCSRRIFAYTSSFITSS